MNWTARVGWAAMALLLVSVAGASELNTTSIEKLTGLKGTMNDAGTVFKVSQPRNDIKVSIDGWTAPPFMGLTSWAAFTPGKTDSVMVMGDFVLMQDEVNPVMSAALDNGLEVTALHNHFFYDEPRVFFMHIGGEGTNDRLATAVGKMFSALKSVRTQHPTPTTGFGLHLPATSSITVAPLERVLGGKAQVSGGMAKFVFGRSTKMPCACEAGKDMGVNTWAAFAGSDNNAIVDGDFAMYEDELQPVLKALRKARFNIVAIHNHMTSENPRIMFLHFFATGSASDLASGIRSALDVQKK